MVAARSRILAIWFTALMLVSIIPAIAPTAAATHVTATSTDWFVKNAAGVYEPYAGQLLKPGDDVRLRVNADVAACTVAPTAVTATLLAQGLLMPAGTNPNGAMTLSSGTSYTRDLDFHIDGNFTAANQGLEGDAETLDVEISRKCGPGGGTQQDDNPPFNNQPGVVETDAIKVDTRAPRMIKPTLAIAAGTSRVNIGALPAKTAAIGSTITLSGPYASDPMGLAKVEVELAPYGWAAHTRGPISLTGTQQTLVIGVNESTAAQTTPLDGTGKAVFYATDAAGNINNSLALPDADEPTVTIDNQRPTMPLAFDFTVGRGELSLSRRSALEAGSENNRIQFNWQTTSTEITHAALRVTPAGGAPILAGATSEPTGTNLGSTITFTIPDNPATPEDENQRTAFTFDVFPVDEVGNLADLTVASNSKPIAFPSFKARYGLADDSPSFLGGSLVGELDIFDITGAAASPAYPATAPGDIYGELRRKGESTDRFWIATQTGNDESHYAATAQTDPSATSPTIFRPAAPLTSTAGTLTLNNLSNRASPNQRNFLDGRYTLAVTLVGSNGNKVTHELRFSTDSGAPAVADHPLYANPRQGTIGPNTNMSQTHGMDGNPFRVLFHTSDERNVSDTGVDLDSGIRSITFQLLDQASQPALRTSTLTPAMVKIDTVSASNWVNVPSYVYNLTTPAPTAGIFCQQSVWATRECVYEEVVENGTWRATWFNGTRFAGWINTTMHDLAPGNYSVRVTVEDHAGLKTVKSYSTGTGSDVFYHVAPAVKILSDTTSPIVTSFVEGGVTKKSISVTALASQRFVDPWSNASIDSNIKRKCRTDTGPYEDVCPVEQIQLFLSNSDTGTNAVAYGPARYGELVDNTTLTESVKGFVNGVYDDGFNGTLKFSNTGVPMKWFYYNSSTQREIPAGIDATKPMFVRAVAYAFNAGDQAISTRSSDWIPVLSIGQSALNVISPTEWQVNVSSSTVPAKPPFSINFTSTDAAAAPRLSYTVTSWNGGATLLSESGLWPRNHTNNVLPKYVFNWTGELKYLTNGTKLPQGSYKLTFQIADGTTLVTESRNFTILDARPTIAASAFQDDPKLLRSASGFNVGRTFFVCLTTSHNDVNLTGFRFGLRYPDAPSGTPVDYTSNGDGTGTNGFKVEITGGLPLQAFTATERVRRTEIIAQVELPAGIRDSADLIFTVTALHDPSPTADSILLKFDKVPPAGTLLVPDTEKSVVDLANSPAGQPTKNLPQATRKPFFKGFVEDFGTGIKTVEVRLVDLTDGKTLQLDPSGNAIPKPGTNVDVWTSSAVQKNAAGQDVRLIELVNISPGVWHWYLNTTGRTNLTTDLYTPATFQSDDSGIIRLDHRYRVDVRFTDRLDQVSAVINSTEVDFDPAAPYLGYKGQLGIANNIPSGIVIGGTRRTLNWHGEGDSLVATVNVTDNHCLRAVRLVGNSTLHPTSVFKANMTPAAWAQTATKGCPNGVGINYTIDLAGAIDIATGKHFFDDVAEYTLWWEAVDWSGQVTEIPLTPVNYRTMKITVLDNTPATLSAVWFDPPVGQAGGRTLVRAQVFENKEVSHVLVKVGNKSANMTKENVTATGSGVWRLDTTDDLGLELDVGEYVFNVTPYDVNWNRTTSPTCPQICFGLSPLYLVRDDGAPAVLLESPAAGATLNATPTLKFRALHKALETTQITVRATTDGNVSNLTPVPTANLSFTELKSVNGTRQGWSVAYSPGGLADNTSIIVNVTASLASLTDSKQFTFVVDSRAPTVTHNVTGTQTLAGKTYATRATRVKLAASDTVSVPSIKYTVNGGAEQTYATEIAPTGADGVWKLEYWATDPAGNVGLKQTLELTLDLTGPRISVVTHGDSPTVTVSDAGAGLNESSVTVHYRYGSATAFTPKKLDKLTGLFGTTLPGNATESGLAYYFAAEDLLGNVGTNFTAAQPYTIRKDNQTVTNLPPTVRITSPTAATPITTGSVEVRWIAEDPEEAPLTITIALRDPAPGRVLVAAGENGGTYTLNTTGFAAGAYTVVVTATDGENSASAQVTFNVENTPVIERRNVPPATVAPNTQVAVSVALHPPAGKTVAQAQYRLLKDGTLATSGLLAPSQGLYGAAFTPSAPGNYSVLVELVYADGTTESPQQVASFRVPGVVTPPDQAEARGAFPVSLMALAAIGVLTVALAAYGAFGRWKK